VAPFGFHPEVIPNGIDLSDYVYRARDRVCPGLLWMRSFHPLYNPEMAVRVLARARQRLPGATLTMAGADKGHEQDVRRLTKQLGVEDQVSFVGFLGPAEKRKYGDACDIYLNTNRVDNSPVSVVEAAAMGLPVVATSVGGLPYLLEHERTALLTPDNDDAAMADAVERLVASPELTARLAKAARAFAEEASWDRIMPRWFQLLERVTARRDAIREAEPASVNGPPSQTAVL